MVGMHHSITAARWLKRSMRRTTRSSSRWGFRFPWKPDLPRLSPLGQGHPVPAYLPPFPSSRGISHNRCVFTFPSSAIFPFSPRGENSRKMRQDYSEKESYPRSNSTSAKYGARFGVVSFLAKRRIPRRDRNVAEVRSTLSFRCLFNGRGREKRRKVIICGQPTTLWNDFHGFLHHPRPPICRPAFCKLASPFFAVSNFISASCWKQLEGGDSWSDN